MFLIYRNITDEQPPAELKLQPAELRHLKARRAISGFEIHLGDGEGRRWRGHLGENGNLKIENVHSGEKRPPPPVITLCSALPDGNRWELILQKGTELGVSNFIPIICEFSQRRNFSKARAERVIEEAAAQSQRYYLPVLHPIQKFSDLSSLQAGRNGVLALVREASQGLSDFVVDRVPEVVVVGPEGGFSEAELEYMKKELWHTASLGDNVLRVETAALAGVAFLSIHQSQRVE